MNKKKSNNTSLKECIRAADNFIKINKKLKSKCYWGIRSEICVNLFLWHLKEFKRNRDPRPEFIKVFKEATEILQLRKNNFKIDLQLLRGVKTDEIEQISSGLPFGQIKYGEAQVKFICTKS